MAAVLPGVRFGAWWRRKKRRWFQRRSGQCSGGGGGGERRWTTATRRAPRAAAGAAAAIPSAVTRLVLDSWSFFAKLLALSFSCFHFDGPWTNLLFAWHQNDACIERHGEWKHF